MKKIIMIILIAVFSQVAMAAIEIDSRTFGETQQIENQPYVTGFESHRDLEEAYGYRARGMDQQVWGLEIRGF